MVYNVNGVKEIIMKQTEQSTDLFPQGGQGGLLWVAMDLRLKGEELATVRSVEKGMDSGGKRVFCAENTCARAWGEKELVPIWINEEQPALFCLTDRIGSF